MFFRPFFFAPVESGLFGFSFGIGQPGEELGIALPWWGFNRVWATRIWIKPKGGKIKVWVWVKWLVVTNGLVNCTAIRLIWGRFWSISGETRTPSGYASTDRWLLASFVGQHQGWEDPTLGRFRSPTLGCTSNWVTPMICPVCVYGYIYIYPYIYIYIYTYIHIYVYIPGS